MDCRANLSGLDLINQVISDPGVLWRKYFFVSVNKLDDDQKEVLLNWFLQMTKVNKACDAVVAGDVHRGDREGQQLP